MILICDTCSKAYDNYLEESSELEELDRCPNGRCSGTLYDEDDIQAVLEDDDLEDDL